MLQQIIPPVDPASINNELTQERFLRYTNKGGNQIYIIDGRDCPAVMREVGRLREEAFRAAGGGTGKECDIDTFDTMDPPCRQLIVWDPLEEKILGGYRFIQGDDIRLNPDGSPRLATSHMFRFSERFMRDCLPYTIELGRSFVRTDYQSSRAGAKALFVLDNLWDGLGALTVVYPNIRYLFGKVTMYPSYDSRCRDMILQFMNLHFADSEHLVEPLQALGCTHTTGTYREMFTGVSLKDDYRTLHKAIRELGYNIPPLVNAYMSLSPSMKIFGTAVNDEFGNVEETGIFLTISEISQDKKGRHIDTFVPETKD